MMVKTLLLTLESDKPIKGTAHELRGFFANKFNEYTLLHQHMFDKVIYQYPRIQFKMINGTPIILGINEGVELLEEIHTKYSNIKLGENIYEIVESGMVIKNQLFEATNNPFIYEFTTPWFALNQDNYLKFFQLQNKRARDEFLSRILLGNLISISKSFSYTITKELTCTVDIKIRKGQMKDVKIMTFIGQFYVNFNLPDFFGIGKSVSKGFGSIRKIGG